jgi:hypothetical protein
VLSQVEALRSFPIGGTAWGDSLFFLPGFTDRIGYLPCSADWWSAGLTILPRGMNYPFLHSENDGILEDCLIFEPRREVKRVSFMLRLIAANSKFTISEICDKLSKSIRFDKIVYQHQMSLGSSLISWEQS